MLAIEIPACQLGLSLTVELDDTGARLLSADEFGADGLDQWIELQESQTIDQAIDLEHSARTDGDPTLDIVGV